MKIKNLFFAFMALGFLFNYHGIAQVADLSERSLMKPSKWYWYTGVTPDKIKEKVSEGFRIIDLEVDQTNPLKLSATFVKNTGVHQKGWWWYYGKTSEQVKQLWEDKKARIIDLEIYYVNGKKRYAVVMVANKGENSTSWWYYSDLEFSEIKTKLNAKNGRLIDLNTYVKNGKRYFSIIMVPNRGTNAKTWWYYSNISADQLKEKLKTNKARLTDIEIHSQGNRGTRFTVIMEKLDGETWWWYYGKTLNQVKDLSAQNGARIFDIEPYVTPSGKKRFAVLMIRNTNDQTNRLRRYLRKNQSGGSYGVYVKRVNGKVQAALQEGKTFYPASTIKALEHLHAMRAVQANQANLSDDVVRYNNSSQSCADNHNGHTPTTMDLDDILSTMMKDSDNQSTNALQEHFGRRRCSSGKKKNEFDRSQCLEDE